MSNKFNVTTTALAIALGVIALSIVASQTGFAVTKEPAQIEFCSDGDLGLDAIHTASVCDDANGLHRDACGSGNTLIEGTCAGTSICAFEAISCPIGEVCANGKCNAV